MVAAIVLGVLIVSAAAAPFLTPYSPTQHDLANSLLPPMWVDGGSSEHVLGTDRFGRDALTRLLYGGRVSLSVAALAILIAVTVGGVVGMTAGLAGGLVDSSLMRLVDVLLSFPSLLIALAISVALGPSYTNLVIVIGLLVWPTIARLIRGETLLIREQEYVKYARAIGIPTWPIILRHVLPNVLPTLLVLVTLEVGHVILVEASLSFLGAGIPPPEPSWGGIISEGRALIATGWWIALFPGLAIVAAVLTCNTLGDSLRDHLDPRTERD